MSSIFLHESMLVCSHSVCVWLLNLFVWIRLIFLQSVGWMTLRMRVSEICFPEERGWTIINFFSPLNDSARFLYVLITESLNYKFWAISKSRPRSIKEKIFTWVEESYVTLTTRHLVMNENFSSFATIFFVMVNFFVVGVLSERHISCWLIVRRFFDRRLFSW